MIGAEAAVRGLDLSPFDIEPELIGDEAKPLDKALGQRIDREALLKLRYVHVKVRLETIAG